MDDRNQPQNGGNGDRPVRPGNNGTPPRRPMSPDELNNARRPVSPEDLNNARRPVSPDEMNTRRMPGARPGSEAAGQPAHMSGGQPGYPAGNPHSSPIGAQSGNPQNGHPAPRPQSVRRSSLPPEKSVIAKDFHKRLRGKPTHAAHFHTWYGGLGHGVAMILKTVLVIVLVIGFVVGGFGGGMLVGYISTAKPVSTIDIMTSEESLTTFVYDSQNHEIARLKSSDNVDRVFISYSDVKDTYIDEAITSIEDERFYEHNGIDIQRIGSAVLSALANGGTATHGGSTITQQVVKMISGKDERSTQRKVQEWFNAMDLEQKYSKDQIMELYINSMPMGNNYEGVQSAAQNYFGKDASQLTLTECAFLAGIPKSPSYYNPLRESGKRNAMRRMRIVLGKMHELGKITDEQYEEALNTELVFKAKSTTQTQTINSYFVEYAISEVIADLQEKRNISYSLAQKLVYNNGYQIYTTMEPAVQSTLDTTYSTTSLFQQDPTIVENFPEKPQSGSVIINVATGAIAAMQGGVGEKTVNLGLNRATGIYRQPGSSIKPLIDYAPALQSKIIVPATTYMDTEVFLDPNNPTTPWPKNSDRSFAGQITIRQAIYASKNTVAVQVWNDLNAKLPGLPLQYLKDVGIDRTKEIYPATAIGGFNVGMSPLEMAAAYATFANNGVYVEPYSYTRVLDNDGNVVIEKDIVSRNVYSPETCYLLTSMLEDVITRGTAAGRVLPITTESGENIAVAGKTGTTDDNVDKWFCGYTPYYAAATWYGYDNRLRTTEIPSVDRQNAQYIWNDYMQKIHTSLAGKIFEMPATISMVTICSTSGNLATEACVAAGTAIQDLFVTSEAPATPCTLHVLPTPTPVPPPPETVPSDTVPPPA